MVLVSIVSLTWQHLIGWCGQASWLIIFSFSSLKAAGYPFIQLGNWGTGWIWATDLHRKKTSALTISQLRHVANLIRQRKYVHLLKSLSFHHFIFVGWVDGALYSHDEAVAHHARIWALSHSLSLIIFVYLKCFVFFFKDNLTCYSLLLYLSCTKIPITFTFFLWNVVHETGRHFWNTLWHSQFFF